VLFFSAGSQSVLPVGGFGTAILTGVLPPCVLATLATNSRDSFSPNRLVCVSVAFSHARISH
jgi:hypothetical protein